MVAGEIFRLARSVGRASLYLGPLLLACGDGHWVLHASWVKLGGDHILLLTYFHFSKCLALSFFCVIARVVCVPWSDVC